MLDRYDPPVIREAPAFAAVTRFVRRVANQPWLLVAAVTTVALAVVAIRALVEGVQLIDERALQELRARDVFTADHPWLGTRSTGGDFNHPGPLQFDLFAVPVRLMGGPVGVTLTVIAVNIAVIWISGVAARGLGGPDLALTVVAAVTILCWTLGSDVLIDPWPANFPVLPFFTLLVLTAAVVAGDHRWLPMVVAVASLCAQTHLSYLLLAPALVVVATVPVVAKAKRQSSRASRRPLMTSAALVVVAWLQPLWQQLFGSGPGNLSEVFAASWRDEDRTGWRLATRLLTSIVAEPPAWWRPGYDLDEPIAWIGPDGDVIGSSRLLSIGGAFAVLAVLIVVAVWCVRTNARKGFKGAKPMLLVGAVAAAGGLITLMSLPLDPFGISVHKFRYLWPLGAFVAATFAGSAVFAVRALNPPARWGPAARWIAPGRWVSPAVVLFAGVLAILTVPTRTRSEGEFTRRDVWPVAAEIRSQVAAVEQAGTVLVETERLPFTDYFTWVIMAELDRQGIDFVADTKPAVLQVGEQRNDDGTADVRLYVVFGEWAAATFDGTRRIAYVDNDHEGLEVGVFIEGSINRPESDGV